MADIEEQAPVVHRKAVVQDGVVVNFIVAEDSFELDGCELITTDEAFIGQLWDGEEFTDPPPPPVELLPIEAWRFEAAIEIAGIKEQIDAAIEAMPEPQRTVAKAKRARVNEYHRDDPLIAALAPALDLDESAVDALWLSAMEL